MPANPAARSKRREELLKENENMKPLSSMLSVVLMSLSTVAFAQSDAQKSSAAPVPSEAQKSFATMKSLAGEWEGPVAVPEMPEMSGGKPTHLSLRVT